jgi:hypothetical protein
LNGLFCIVEKQAKADEFDEKIKLSPADYPPESFEQLAEDLKGNFSTRKFWKCWYLFWQEQGKEAKLLQQLTPHSMTFIDRHDDKRYLLAVTLHRFCRREQAEKLACH